MSAPSTPRGPSVRRAIDVLAAGPPSPDLYEPAAPAWALAAGLVARGHSVHVVYPGPAEVPLVPPGVSVTAFSPVTAHLGSLRGDAELARSAARRLRPDAEVIVRDPSGLGSLGRAAGRRPQASFVRSLAVDGFAPAHGVGQAIGASSSPPTGWDRSTARRLERDALNDARVVCCSTPAQRDRLLREYGLAPPRVQCLPGSVAVGPEAPSRKAARALLTLPEEDLVTVALPPAGPSGPAALESVLEAFGRMRLVFPGARLLVVGTEARAAPGVAVLPARDAGSVTTALASADVAVAYAPAAGGDPGLVLAWRAGVASVVGPSADLDEGAGAAVRRAEAGGAAELASALAELLSDPEERRSLGERGREHARRFEPERLAEALDASGALLPP